MSVTLPPTTADAPPSSLSDAELVDRFVAVRDPSAFAELVFRHRALVLGVCGRVLRNGSDIEDVFQATFLVLVRDAARVRRQQSVASWLYGVAHRLSLRVARQTRKRREIMLVERDSNDNDVLQDLASRHDQQLLDAELNSLPEQYRIPLVLRYLAGKPPREIAQELAMTPGTLDGLLKRGKDELRVRLMRRGVTLTVTLIAIQVSQHAASAADTLPLIDATIKAGLAWQNGLNMSPDFVSHRALELSGKELTTMTTLTKTCLATVATLGMAAACVSASYAIGNPQDGSGKPGGDLETSFVPSLPARQDEPGAELLIAQGPPPGKPESRTQGFILGEPPEQGQKPAGSDGSSTTSGVSDAAPKSGPGVGAAAPARAPSKNWDRKQRSPSVKRIEAALEQSTEVSFTDNPLEEALHYLKELHHVEIWLDRAALQDEGVATDQPVALEMAGISLKSGLAMILEPLGLDYVIKNDVLTITTAAKANEHFETRVYDVSRLKGVTPTELDQIIRSTIAPDTWTPITPPEPPRVTAPAPALKAPEAAPAEGAAGSGGMGGGGGGGSSLSSEGNIRSTKTSLVIRQTQRVHSEIVDLLDQLDATSPAGSGLTPTPEPKPTSLLQKF